jgi:ribosomal protein S18 acetylase RimI-like enzyme
MSEITIRRLSEDDADRVRELDGLILGPDRSGTWDEYVGRFLATSKVSIMSTPTWGSFVAEEDRELVGFILAEPQSAGYGLPPGIRIVAIAVHPEHRRKGIGRLLIQALKNDSKARGIRQIFSALRSEDERDLNFLTSCGFDGAHVKVLTARL